MDLNFKGLPQLLKRFPDKASAREYLEQQIWGGTPQCPFCGCYKWYKLSGEGLYKCGNKECYKKYTVTIGTIFHGSHIPLNIWFCAMYILASHKKGISSYQLAKDLNITQKSAWYMGHRIRKMVKEKQPQKLKGIIEADETYMARKFHAELKPRNFDFTPSWPNIKEKGCVFGMAQRGGKVIIKVFESNNAEDIRSALKNNIEKKSWLFTDGSNIYKEGLTDYKQDSVIHSRRQYVKGDIYTNNIENFGGIMKRGIYGIYHQVSYKHLQRYCDEFSFRYNSRKLADNERFTLSLKDVSGRLKYSQLISNEPKQKEVYKKEETEWD